MLVSGTTGFAELEVDFGAETLYLDAPLSEPSPDEPIEVLLSVLLRIGPVPLSIGWVADAVIAPELAYDCPADVVADSPVPAGDETTLLVAGPVAAGLVGSVCVGPLK